MANIMNFVKSSPFGLPDFRPRAAPAAEGRSFSAASVVERSYSAAAATDFARYNTMYYVKSALAGGICCSVTHGLLCPVDVVKTRMQLEPEVYNKGMIGGFRQVIAKEGVGALATGLGPTIVGYFVQGWFKFGGVELVKVSAVKNLGDARAWELKTPIYLASAACAEFVADLFLCPLEATRIRLVSDPTFATGLVSGATRLAKDEGVIRGFYSGLGPILLKQIPYTMAKFAVQGVAADAIYSASGTNAATSSSQYNVSVSLASGTIAGVAAAIISHPADTLLSKVNKAGAGGEGSIMTRLGRIASEIGMYKLCTTGLGARCVMIGSLTALQFGIFDTVMESIGASKYRFKTPEEIAA